MHSNHAWSLGAPFTAKKEGGAKPDRAPYNQIGAGRIGARLVNVDVAIWRSGAMIARSISTTQIIAKNG
eukprot:6042966-Karenia_brevis.AAC.1